MVAALEAIEEAKSVFNEKLVTSFKPAIDELEGLNYPGFSDPKISITSKIDPSDSLDHKTAVQFKLPGVDSLFLPEKYNGLGYQNLISMVFHLIRFRAEWMRVGKAAKDQDIEDVATELLHVVLIEEPEAHLHAQVQQVFIKKAYDVLRNHTALKNFTDFRTQMIVSTHSSHIAHELDFSCLRYFRREPATNKGDIPTARVINLSRTFGSDDDTSKFATRYLRTTHCDLFFADAAILVEGSAERLLIPHFIRVKFLKLDQCYISLLEIGGAHAHRLKTDCWIHLGYCLWLLQMWTQLIKMTLPRFDHGAARATEQGTPHSKNGCPRRNCLMTCLIFRTPTNGHLMGWLGSRTSGPIRVEYKDGESEDEALPYTFEDSLALTNIALFRKFVHSRGLLKKLHSALRV